MLMQHIEGANLLLMGDGVNILHIHAMVQNEEGYKAVTTAWEPTPAELARLNEGKPVYVTILCLTGVPPVRVEVKP